MFVLMNDKPKRDADIERIINAAICRGIAEAEAGLSEDAEIVLMRLRRKHEAIATNPAA